MKVYRRVGQTKFVKDGLDGLLTLHDDGRLAVSRDHKILFNGLPYRSTVNHYCIDKPTTKDRKVIFDRLFDFRGEE